MSLERSRKTQSVSEGAERAREPSTDKKIAISQEFGDFFCICQKNVVTLQRKIEKKEDDGSNDENSTSNVACS